jgi:hypothetical protein
VIGIGVFVIATLIVLAAIFGKLPDKWPDLMLNLGTELMGIVITVLIIDWLIQRRERYHGRRRRVTGNLGFIFYDVLQRMLPECYDWRIKDLQNECRWFRQKWNARESYFSSDEQVDITNAFHTAEQILEQLNTYSTLRQKIDDLTSEIHHAIREHNTKDGVEPIYLHKLAWHERVEDEYVKLKSRGNFNRDVCDAALTQLRAAKMPPALNDLFQRYIESLQAIISLHTSIHQRTREYERLFQKAEANVHEESALD